MHVPDGYLTPTGVLVTASVGVGVLAYALYRSRSELHESTVPVAGLMAAALFSVRLINVPLAAGTSAHLLAGVLTAVLIGPFTAVLCGAVVLLAHSVVMGFGGVASAGASFLVMDVIPIAVGYSVFRAVQHLRSSQRWWSISAGVGAAVGVLSGAGVFVLLTTLSSVVSVPVSWVAAIVIGAHLPVAAIEAVLTASILTAVVQRQPRMLHTPPPAKAEP